MSSSRFYCTECDTTLPDQDLRSCTNCGSTSLCLAITPEPGHLRLSIPGVTVRIDRVSGSTREERLEARLRALIAAADQLADSLQDDDKDLAIVVSERLHRILGFARRNDSDLQDGSI